MENVKILIVEDELLIAEGLRSMLEGMGYEVPAIFVSGRKALEAFRPGIADIIIMDINLADDINGIETSIEIRKISTAPIIYITDNKDEYFRKKAIFETNAVQYISKPFTRMEVSVAIDLALKAIKNQGPNHFNTGQSAMVVYENIFVKENHVYKKIQVSDILYLKADGSYCNLYYKTAAKDTPEKMVFTENLSYLEERLEFARELVRVHRSYIINIRYVNRFQENRLWIDDQEIQIGKTYKKEIKERFRVI